MGPVPSLQVIHLRMEQEPPVHGRADSALMDRVRAGDREAYREVLERYWSQLVVYAVRVVQSEDAAQDVVQEAFIRVWRHRKDWVSGGSVSAYLYRVTRNLALNSRRDHAAELGRRKRAGSMFVPTSPASDPFDDLSARALAREVEAAIASLPARRREAFVLSRFHGLSYSEIGEAMGISYQTVANQMAMALAHLRRALAEHMDE